MPAKKTAAATKRTARKSTKPPAIGKPWQGGIYAGLTLSDNKPMHLVLLPGDDKKPWPDAVKHAAASKALLPSRFDGLLLFKNVPGEFEKAWYWLDEQDAANDACAWIQSFAWGSQYGVHKSHEYRVRLVRRFPI